MGDTERRQYPRVRRYYGVKYRTSGGSFEEGAAEQVGMITNLSLGGAVLVSRQPLDAGSLIEIDFPEPVFEGTRTLRGRIVWLRQDETGKVEAGCDLRGEQEEPAEEGWSVEGPAFDRRRYPRLEQRLPVTVRCVTPGPFHEQEPRGAVLRDFSEGGVEIVTTREYVPRLVIELRFPESPTGPARTFYGRVLHSSGCDEAGQFALGCAFIRPANARR